MNLIKIKILNLGRGKTISGLNLYRRTLYGSPFGNYFYVCYVCVCVPLSADGGFTVKKLMLQNNV